MNIENLTDDDILNMQAPPPVDAPAEEQGGEAISEGGEGDQPVVEDDQTPPDENAGDEPVEGEGGSNEDGGEADAEAGTEPKTEDLSDADLGDTPPTPKKVEEKETAPKKETVEGDLKAQEAPKNEEPPKVEGEAINFETEYKKLIGAPIKANGREIVLKSVDEAVRLVQQGANYAKRMEELKPARKQAAMLESAGLLGNEVALSHMIDLYNGKPEAIAKMVKELNIDIYSLDLASGDNYTPNSHLRSDDAFNFQETIKEVRTLDGGEEAMKLIEGWDMQSRQIIWGNSAAVRQIYDYKQSGVYDIVATEVERRKLLGDIPEGTPFIKAFQAVGDELSRTGQLGAPAAPAPAPEQRTTPLAPPAKQQPRTPISSGPAPRKQPAPDSRAAAASAPRAGVGAVKEAIDIFSLSDDDIAKMQSPAG